MEGRRAKILQVPRRFMLDAVRRCKSLGTYSAGCGCIPEGSDVLEVQANYPCGTVDFLIEHESFDVVADGYLLPNILCECRLFKPTLSVDEVGSPVITVDDDGPTVVHTQEP